MLSPDKVLSHYYLDTRCKLIEIAAMLDRYDRAVGTTGKNGQASHVDERLAKIRQALSLLAQPGSESNRSEQLLLMFSDLD